MAKVTLTVKQGKTYRNTMRWEAPPYVYKAITAVSQSAPASITVPSHGIPDGWRVAIESVKGMTQINMDSVCLGKPLIATVVDANTIELNEINSSEFKAYTSGGYVKFLTPVDMAGYSCRMEIKEKGGGAVIWSGVPVIDNVAKTVTVTITAAETAAFTFSSADFEIEMESSGGVVTQLAAGTVKLEKEVLVD